MTTEVLVDPVKLRDEVKSKYREVGGKNGGSS